MPDYGAAQAQFLTSTVTAAGGLHTSVMGGLVAYDPIARKIQERKQARIEKRARALLYSYLTTEQIVSYEKSGTFIVRGNDTDKPYEVHANYCYELTSDGARAAHLCFMPSTALCGHDVVLAKKIALETDEKATLKVANRSLIPGARGSDYERLQEITRQVIRAEEERSRRSDVGDRWGAWVNSFLRTGR